jgi:hypothetical protein
MFQAVPSFMPIYDRLGGDLVTPRMVTSRAIKRVYPSANVSRDFELFPSLSGGRRKLEYADLIIAGAPYINTLKPYSAKKYMVFHGTYAYMGIREIKRIAHFDRICVLGPRMMNLIEKSGLSDRAELSGYLPFMNYPSRNTDERIRFLKSLGLDPLKRTVVYLPWGKPYGSWDLMARKLLKEVPQDYNLILRPHPSQAVSLRLRDQIEFFKIKELVKSRRSTYLDLTSQKLSLIYANVDLIISDGTSPAEESLYYDIPQVFIETKRFSRDVVVDMLREEGSDSDHIEQVTQLYGCGQIITPDVKNLELILYDAISSSGFYSESRQNYFNFVFGNRSFDLQHNLIESIRKYA